MKKIISIIIILLLISITTTTFSYVHVPIAFHAMSHEDKIDTIQEVADYILKETDCQELKNYILENKDYLYLNNEDKAKEVVNKYDKSNLEETKQFIVDNYYDENKPEKEKRFTDIILITIFVMVVIMIMITFIKDNNKYVLYK